MIRLRLFGAVSLEGPTGALTGRCAQPRQLAVLVRLAGAPNGSLTRDKLIGCFWPEEPEATARHRLRDVIYLLRRDLGYETIVSAGQLLRVESTRVRTDVGDFRSALDEGDLRRVIELYSGPFLDGFYLAESPRFEEWVESERRRLGRRYSRALERLAEQAGESGDPTQAVEWWEKRSAEDPLDSLITLKLMAAYVDCGRPARAIRRGRAHENLLRMEFDIEPDPKVRAFIERLQDGTRDGPTAGEERDVGDLETRPDLRGEEIPGTRPASPVEDPLPPTGTSCDAGRARKGVPWLLLPGLILAATVLVLTVSGGDPGEQASPGISGAIPERSVAVLPFEDLNPGDQAGHFVRGMHEAVLTSLASLEDLVVTSPGSVLPAEATSRAPGAIARELGVSYLLLGSVQRAGDRIRVTARLLDAETGRQLWAERLERRFTADEVFDIQSRVARATASALDVSLSPEERGRVARRPTGQIEAYDYYLRGQERLGFVAGEPVVDREAVEQAIALFDQGLRLDPDFALAHVGLARSYMELAEMEGGPWDDSVRVAAARALELDPRLPDAHLAMAWFHRSRKSTEGRTAHLEEIRHVLELRPNDSRAALEVAWRWSIKRGMGRLDQIACWSKRAAQLEPTNPELLRVMALFFWTLGDHEAAQRRAERALKLEPDAIRIYELLVRIALSRGDRAGALAHYEMARSVASSSAPDLTGLGMMETYLGMLDSARVHLDAVSGRLERFPEKVIHFAYALWETGYRERAGEILAWREARERRVLEREILGFWPAFNLARVLAVRGEIEGAMDAMEVAVERGGWLYARAAPEIDGPLRKLWGNERFDSLMAEARSEAERMRGRIEREGCDAIRELPEPEGLSVR